MSEASLRILTGLLGAPIVLALLYVGGWAAGALVLAVAWRGQYEIHSMMVRDQLPPVGVGAYALGGAVVLAPVLPGEGTLAFVLFLILLAVQPFRAEEHPFRSMGATLTGALYPGLPLSTVLLLREGTGLEVTDGQAFLLTAAVLVLVWITDILAYYVGRAVGKRPLAPILSPKKTWEGSIGGALGTLAVALVLKGTVLGFLSWIDLLVVALLCAGLGQVGDLVESGLKRSVQVKDAGSLLPGHGGIMDRIDALVLAVPVVYLYLAYLGP